MLQLQVNKQQGKSHSLSRGCSFYRGFILCETGMPECFTVIESIIVSCITWPQVIVWMWGSLPLFHTVTIITQRDSTFVPWPSCSYCITKSPICRLVWAPQTMCVCLSNRHTCCEGNCSWTTQIIYRKQVCCIPVSTIEICQQVFSYYLPIKKYQTGSIHNLPLCTTFSDHILLLIVNVMFYSALMLVRTL